MSFNLKFTFTGLIMFVPNACRNSKAQMCALVVDGRQEDRKALDGTSLRPHRAFVKFPVENLSPTKGTNESFGLWYLERERLILELEPIDSKPNEFEIQNMVLAAGVPHPEEPDVTNEQNRQSFSWALDLERLSPDFRLDPRILEPTPPEETALAHIMISEGKLKTAATTPVVWACDTTLSDQIYNQAFAHVIELVFEGLEEARILSISFDNPDKIKVLDLGNLQRDGRVEVNFVNTCQHNPLQWDITQTSEADIDTKWHFQLLTDEAKQTIVDKLRRAELPVPRPLRPAGPGGAPGSGNCIPPKLRTPVQFTVPELDGRDFNCESDKTDRS
jgi:hypothetical protein